MAVFCIDTSTGRVATQRQLIEVGIANGIDAPPRPWLAVRGTSDATTLWYAVLRKRERGIFIGSLVLRHSAHHASLLERGWEEVEVADIAAPPAAEAPSQPM